MGNFYTKGAFNFKIGLPHVKVLHHLFLPWLHCLSLSKTKNWKEGGIGWKHGANLTKDYQL